MARVVGSGGAFLTADDPAALAAWYARWLRFDVQPEGGARFEASAVPAGGYAVFSLFPRDPAYFTPSRSPFMVNLMVDDLRGALAQVVEGGGTVVGDPEDWPYGRFGWFLDPEGNKVELWEPRVPDEG